MSTDYYDQQVLLMRRNEKRADNTLLEEGIYVGEHLMMFSRMELIDKRISVLLPESFIDLPAEMAKMKYPSEERPQEIKSSLDTTVNFTFRLFLNEAMSSIQTEPTLKQYTTFLTKMNPSIKVLEKGSAGREGGCVSWLQYKSFAVDGQVFNVSYVTSIDEKMFFGGFNCFFEDRLDWFPAVQQVLESLQDNRKARFKAQAERGL